MGLAHSILLDLEGRTRTNLAKGPGFASECLAYCEALE